MKRNALLLLVTIAIVLFTSCKKEYLDVSNPTAVTYEDAFKDFESTAKTLNGVLGSFYNYDNGDHQYNGGLGMMSVHARLDVFGDDVINSMSAYYMGMYRWTTINDEKSGFVSEIWDVYYDKIKALNYILRNVPNIKIATDAERQQIEGEARILRAYCYHQLTQLYGKRYEQGKPNDNLGVVIRDETSSLDPLPRSTVKQCYDFIVSDLDIALKYLKDKPIPKGYANNWIGATTAYAIAARVYQTMSDWEKVVEYTGLSLEAAKAEGYGLASSEELLSGFNNAKCREWIWGYEILPEEAHAWDSFFGHFGYTGKARQNGLRLAVNRDIYDAMGDNDCRRKWWICADLGHEPPQGTDYYFSKGGWEFTGQSVKFSQKPNAEKFLGDQVIMRLCLVYYMRAEALARLNRDAESQQVLDEVMKTRDPDYSASSFTGDALVDEVLRNKRIDLWLEGERFFDIKRLKIIPDRISSKNGQIIKANYPASYATFLARNSGTNTEFMPKDAESPNWEFMIPLAELEGSGHVVEQNPLHIAR